MLAAWRAGHIETKDDIVDLLLVDALNASIRPDQFELAKFLVEECGVKAASVPMTSDKSPIYKAFKIADVRFIRLFVERWKIDVLNTSVIVVFDNF